MPRLKLDRDTQVDIVDGRTRIESYYFTSTGEWRQEALAMQFPWQRPPTLCVARKHAQRGGDKTPTYHTYFQLFGLLKKIKSVNKVEQYSPTAGIKLADSHGPANVNTNTLLSFWVKFTSYSNKTLLICWTPDIFTNRLLRTTYFNINYSINIVWVPRSGCPDNDNKCDPFGGMGDPYSAPFYAFTTIQTINQKPFNRANLIHSSHTLWQFYSTPVWQWNMLHRIRFCANQISTPTKSFYTRLQLISYIW